MEKAPVCSRARAAAELVSSGLSSVAVSLSLCMRPRLTPESCVLWQRGGDDVDRRGNNNENTIKSRLHSKKK